MKVVLCGFHWAGCRALELLLERQHDVVVYTHPAPPYVPDLAELCRTAKVPYDLHVISSQSLQFKPDVIASIYYRRVIPPHVLDLADGRAFNLHPSLLPKYRGCSSLAWALINGENEVGYTYHYMDAEVDTGDIILQKKMPIYAGDTGLILYLRVMSKAMEDFLAVLDAVQAGTPGRPQEGTASYYARGCPMDGVIGEDWEDTKVARFIRALVFPPFPPARYRGCPVRTFGEYEKLRRGIRSEDRDLR